MMMTMTTMNDRAEPEFSLTRRRVERLLAMIDAKRANGGLNADEAKAHEVATLRLFGAGASPKKFARIDAQQVDGVLRGQYRFAGAGQTGRLSSRGAQIHNLTRDVLGEDGGAEAALVDAIADGCSYAELAAANPVDVPPARKLALVVRPALVAGPGKVFDWSDFSMVEARVNPWLAASPGADKVLDIFRANDRDPSLPDIYTLAAADILHKDPRAITKTERAIGKVAVLALGFGGAVGALQRMALNYRIHLDDAEARRIVDAWREANPWAREFWGVHRDGESFGLWGAAMRAWEIPGEITTAGRIAFIYREDYLGGVAVHGAAVGAPAHLSAAKVARCRYTGQGRKADRRETQRAVVSARPWTREAMARHSLRERGAGHRRRPPAPDRNPNRDQPGACVHADPHDDA